MRHFCIVEKRTAKIDYLKNICHNCDMNSYDCKIKNYMVWVHKGRHGKVPLSGRRVIKRQ